MVPKLIKLLEDALEEARSERQSFGRSDQARQGAIVVTHLEDALLRARLMYGIGESV